MKISLVVPCYNEEDVVFKFYKEVISVFDGKIEDFEFVFVNDGSSDGTLDHLRAIHKVADNVKVVSFSRNFGKEAAMYAGLSNACGEYTCVIDADLQQRPEVILKMAEILDNDPEVDCVAAYQEDRKESKFITFCKDKFYALINKVSDVDFYPGASDFRLMRRPMVDAVLSMKEYYRFSKGLFSFVGYNTEFIPYEVQERVAGTSKWSFIDLLKYAIEGIVGYTTVPLKISTFAGAISIAASVLYLIISLIVGAVTRHLTSAVAIITLLLLLGGMNFVFIGIVGEYLARTYMQSKDRPVYIVKELLTYDDE